MQKLNDLSRSLTPLKPDRTLIAVMVRRPTLTVSVRASGKRGAGRDEETSSQIEQRN